MRGLCNSGNVRSSYLGVDGFERDTQDDGVGERRLQRKQPRRLALRAFGSVHRHLLSLLLFKLKLLILNLNLLPLQLLLLHVLLLLNLLLLLLLLSLQALERRWLLCCRGGGGR